MRKVVIGALLLLLAGCAGLPDQWKAFFDAVRERAKVVCGFEPVVDSIQALIGIYWPAGQIPADGLSQLVDAICHAPVAQQYKKGASDVARVVTAPNGQVVIVHGRFVAPVAKFGHGSKLNYRRPQ